MLLHVTAHVTVKLLCFTIDSHILPHVTATLFQKKVYISFKKVAVTCSNM